MTSYLLAVAAAIPLMISSTTVQRVYAIESASIVSEDVHVLSGGSYLSLISPGVNAALDCAAGSVSISAGTSSSLGNRVLSSETEGLSNKVWLRDFDPPLPFPVVINFDENNYFQVAHAQYGILRFATSELLYDTTNTECEVDYELVFRENGYDIRYQITNPTEEPQPLPTLRIYGNLLEDKIEYLLHNYVSEFTELDDSEGNGISSRIDPYPEVQYAPVIVARDSRYAVGFSLKYPVMEYKHSIRTKIGRNASGSRLGDAWYVEFRLDGDMAGSEVRTYDVSVAYRGREDWIHTLQPYKEFLYEEYGNIKYQQDMQPVFGLQIGDRLRITSDNPRGMTATRPDLNGWTAEIANLLDYVKAYGYQRVMIWTAAGVYKNNIANNFPPQIMTEWTSPMNFTAQDWQLVSDDNIELMFWWGRSDQVADRWDDNAYEDLDPENSEHRKIMGKEWVSALEVGACGLGLDAFDMAVWDALPWLDDLKERLLQAKFIIEPFSCDILHMYYPTFLQGDQLTQPHLLADYLVPGREIWVLLRGDQVTYERAVEVINWGMTVVTKYKGLNAFDLQDEIDRAQSQDWDQ